MTCPTCARPLTAVAHGSPFCAPCTIRPTTSARAFRQRWRLADLVGTGGTGVVYRGVEAATGREVAIKFWLKLDNRDLLERFRREGELLARLAHPHVVEL